MGIGYWLLLLLIATGILVYNRASMTVWSITAVVIMGFATAFTSSGAFILTLSWIIVAAIAVLFTLPQLRQNLFSRRILKIYRKLMPRMSRTEREALEAGSITWEGELFRGGPDWGQLFKYDKATLSDEEQAFIDGPVQKLCSMCSDWEITHEQLDLPPAVWQFLKDEGFFSLIIKKQYGGKEFSAYAHSQILVRLYGVSVTLASTVAVPNSLGPAELLQQYGTDEQKEHYLPRLAKGQEIPCFALTGPDAGSDAASIPDTGVVCKGTFDGQEITGIRLNWNKRYITLAPVATVVGLAFKLEDPEHLLGNEEEVGITCALIPRDTAGVKIGRRHFPLNVPFQNGPTQGENVFIPLDWIIGGAAMAGQGWRMLMECLAAGRAISLPSSALGGSKVASFSTGAYARIRRQFNMPIGRFEGVQEAMARIGGNTYIIDSALKLGHSIVDSGEHPAVLSAILKYHGTELGRQVANDAMDVHGGKGICLGRNNYLGRTYQGVPIGITVEGANILTRSLIIFGQGAVRCHPFAYAEMEAAKQEDKKKALRDFDKAFFGHIGYVLSNVVRSFTQGLTHGYLFSTPRKGKTKRYYQQINRLSANFALLAESCMLIFQGDLKRMESLTGRLGDILSMLYLCSAVLKRFEDDGAPEADLPLVHWACRQLLFNAQQQIMGVLRNFKNQPLAFLIRALIFPLGRRFYEPRDFLNRAIAELMMAPTEARKRLTDGIYIGDEGHRLMGELEEAFLKVIAVEPLEKRILKAVKAGQIKAKLFPERIDKALAEGLISELEAKELLEAHVARSKIIAVDDFSPEELLSIAKKPKAKKGAAA